jgi:nitrate reductase gamma subunit
MDIVAYVLSYITPYIALSVFLGGIAYQVNRWRQKSPVPAHMSLYPRPEGRLSRLGDTLVDMFTLRGLLQVNRMLWIGGFIMHVGLLLLLVGHIRAFTDFYFLWDWLGWGEEETHLFSAIAGTIAGVLFMVPLFYLWARRWSGPVKWLSTPEDYFALVLLMGIGITGMHMRLVLDPDQHAVRTFLQSLFNFSWKPTPESAGLSFVYHFSLVQLLMIYFPFSKLMHTIGTVFSKLVARS